MPFITCVPGGSFTVFELTVHGILNERYTVTREDAAQSMPGKECSSGQKGMEAAGGDAPRSDLLSHYPSLRIGRTLWPRYLDPLHLVIWNDVPQRSFTRGCCDIGQGGGAHTGKAAPVVDGSW
jgi:hypothetical protein